MKKRLAQNSHFGGFDCEYKNVTFASVLEQTESAMKLKTIAKYTLSGLALSVKTLPLGAIVPTDLNSAGAELADLKSSAQAIRIANPNEPEFQHYLSGFQRVDLFVFLISA